MYSDRMGNHPGQNLPDKNPDKNPREKLKENLYKGLLSGFFVGPTRRTKNRGVRDVWRTLGGSRDVWQSVTGGGGVKIGQK